MLKTIRKIFLLPLLLACCLKAHAGTPDTIRIVFIGDVMSHGPQVTAALRSAPPADGTKRVLELIEEVQGKSSAGSQKGVR